MNVSGIDAFFISNTFVSNIRLKLAKNQVKAKQHPEAELLLLENYSCSSKLICDLLKNVQKTSVSVLKIHRRLSTILKTTRKVYEVMLFNM